MPTSQSENDHWGRATCKGTGMKETEYPVVSLSETSCFLHSYKPLPLHARVWVRFEVDSGEDEVEARVTGTRLSVFSPDECGFELTFTRSRTGSGQALRKLVKRKQGPEAANAPDRREDPRLPIALASQLRVDDRILGCTVENLSMSGALLGMTGAWEDLPSEGASVRLHVARLRFNGVVARCVETDGRPQLGIQFDPLDGEQACALEDLLLEQIFQDGEAQ